MKERPILFSGPMVRAILAGRKTQTRRRIHPDIASCLDDSGPPDYLYETKDNEVLPVLTLCPYGAPGDRLWVRETWAHETDFGTHTGKALYRADGDKREIEYGKPTDKWRPSIHMPRCYSRLTLEVVSVRVERVQEISEKDATAEGLDGYVMGQGPVSRGELAIEPGYWHERFYRLGFQHAWDAMHAKRGYGWDANPWVWIVEFRGIAILRGSRRTVA
jgi:hypothetical protein